MTTKENTTKDLKDQDETVDTTQKSKSKEPKKKEMKLKKIIIKTRII